LIRMSSAFHPGANMAEQTLKFNVLAYHTDRIVRHVKDMLEEKDKEEADFDKQILEQKQLIAKLESDKTILFSEYKNKCAEVESKKRKLEEADKFMDDKNSELDEMACSLGSVINRFEIRAKRAEGENKKLKNEMVSYVPSYD